MGLSIQKRGREGERERETETVEDHEASATGVVRKNVEQTRRGGRQAKSGDRAEGDKRNWMKLTRRPKKRSTVEQHAVVCKLLKQTASGRNPHLKPEISIVHPPALLRTRAKPHMP